MFSPRLLLTLWAVKYFGAIRFVLEQHPSEAEKLPEMIAVGVLLGGSLRAKGPKREPRLFSPFYKHTAQKARFELHCLQNALVV